MVKGYRVDKAASVTALMGWLVAEDDRVVVTNQVDVLPVILPLLTADGAMLDHERLVVVALDRRGRVIDVEVLTKGSDWCTIVDPKQIFRWALTRSRPAASIILAHNHPSGDPTPSKQDVEVTVSVRAISRIVGIVLNDHIIIGSNGDYRSLAVEGLCL